MCRSRHCSERSLRQKRSRRLRRLYLRERKPRVLLKPSTKHINGVMAFLIGLSPLITALAAAALPTARYTYTKAAADLSTLALIVNGIALEQGLTDGSVNRTEMINELLNLKVSLDEMETENVLGLTDELNGIGSAVEKGCAGGKCLDTKIVQDGVAVLKQIKSLSSDKARAALDGPLKLLVQARQIYRAIDQAASSAKALSDELAKLSTVQEDDEDEVFKYVSSLNGAIQNAQAPSRKKFEQSFKAVKDDKTAKYSFSESVDTVIGLGTQTSSISSKKGLLSSMSSELTKAASLSSSLKTLLSTENLSSLDNKLRMVSAIGNTNSPSSKKWTPGFFNGYSDIKNLSSVWDTSFVKKVLAPDTPTQRLTQFFSGVIKEGEAMKPLLNISESQDSLSNVRPGIIRVLQGLNDSLKEVDSLKLLGDLQKCIPSGDLTTSFDSKGWDTEKKLINTLGNGAAEFINLVKDSKASFTTTKLQAFHEAVKTTNEKKTFANIKAFTTMNEVTAELQTLQQALAALLPASFKAYSDASKLESLVKNTNTWMQSFQVAPTVCSKAGEDVIANPQVPSISALLNLRPVNLNPISSAISSLKAPLEAWQQFKKARKTRAAKSDPIPKLKNATGVAQTLIAGVKFVRIIARVEEVNKNLKAVLAAEKEIDAAVMALPAGEKAEVTKTWNPATTKALKRLSAEVERDRHFMKKRPDRIIWLRNVFFDVNQMEVPDFDGQLLALRLSSLQAPAGIQQHLKAIETLNLQKASGKAENDWTAQLSIIENFFDAFFGIERDSDDSTEAADEGGVSGVTIGLIAAGVVGGGLIVGGYFWYRHKESKKKDQGKGGGKDGDNKDDDDKNSKDSKDSKDKKGKKGKEGKKGNKKKGGSKGSADQKSSGSNEPASKGSASKESASNESTSKTGDSTASGPSGAPPPPSKNQQQKNEEGPKDIDATLKDTKMKLDVDVDGNKIVVASRKKQKPQKRQVWNLNPFSQSAKDRKLTENRRKERRLRYGRYKCDEKELRRHSSEDGNIVIDGDKKKKLDMTDADVRRAIEANKKQRTENAATLKKFIQLLVPTKHILQKWPSFSFETIKDFILQHRNSAAYEKPGNYKAQFLGITDKVMYNSPEAKRGDEASFVNQLKSFSKPAERKLDDTQPISQEASELPLDVTQSDANVAAGSREEDDTRPSAGSDSEDESSEGESSGGESSESEETQPMLPEDLKVQTQPMLPEDLKEHTQPMLPEDLKVQTQPMLPEDLKEQRAEEIRNAFRHDKWFWRPLTNWLHVLWYCMTEKRTERPDSFTENDLARAEAGKNEQELKFPEPTYGTDGKVNFTEDFLIHSLVAMMHKNFVSPLRGRFNFLCNKHFLSANLFVAMAAKATNNFNEDKALLRLQIRARYVGDVHGTYAEFVVQVVLALLDPNSTMVFLGDYVDRAQRGLDIFYLMCILKILLPTKFFFLRGNHETAEVNTFHGFNDECRFTFGEQDGERVFLAVNQLFDSLPMAAIVNGTTFLSHGGVSPYFKHRDGLDLITKNPRKVEEIKVFNDLLWGDPRTMSDPHDLTRPVYHVSKRSGLAVQYNSFAVKEIMEAHGLDLILRAHEVKKEGIDFFADGKVVTIFGYTNGGNDNKSSQLVMDNSGGLGAIQFENYVKTNAKDEMTETS